MSRTEEDAAARERELQLDRSAERLIVPSVRDLGGGFKVRRALPSPRQRAIGPFVFFDQMGPMTFGEGQALDVRPHPHIGLSTLTYLFDGEILHRDSLGTVQNIRPGDVNWMTAGRGIVHSERTPVERRVPGERLFGIQCWLALPKAQEECEPSFVHLPASALPVVAEGGVRLRVIAGELEGARSPLEPLSPTLYADLEFNVGSQFELGAEYEERGVYVAAGDIAVAGGKLSSGELLVIRPRERVVLRAAASARVLIFGGEAVDGPRHLWWNFVSSSMEPMKQAKDAWRNGKFAAVPGETEFIPLPEEPPGNVRYP